MQLPQRLAGMSPIPCSASGRHGRTISVREPKVVTRDQAAAHGTGFGRLVFGRLPFENALLLTRGEWSG